jgi:hypothetical protein
VIVWCVCLVALYDWACVCYCLYACFSVRVDVFVFSSGSSFYFASLSLSFSHRPTFMRFLYVLLAVAFHFQACLGRIRSSAHGL